MKAPVPRPLTEEDLKPYMSGYNIVYYVIPSRNGESPDSFVGRIKKICTVAVEKRIQSLTITTTWLAHVRKLENAEFHIIGELRKRSIKRDCESCFQNPMLTKDRSPLTFEVGGEVIQITHLTDIAIAASDLERLIEKMPA